MSFIPLSPKAQRGFDRPDFTSPNREETIARLWRFVRGIVSSGLRLPDGAASGYIARSDGDGNLSWTNILPATSASHAAQTANQTDTLVSAATGEYLVTIYAQITTAGAAGTFYASVSYTDDVGGPTTLYPTASLPCNATGRSQGSAILRCSAGGIDYTFEIVGGAGSPAYTAYVSAVKVR